MAVESDVLSADQLRTARDLLDVGAGRPFSPSLSAGLHDHVERAVLAAGPLPERPLRLWKGRLNLRARCEGLYRADLAGERPPFSHGPASAAGALAHRAIELDVSRARAAHPERVARVALSRLRRDRDFGPFWASLDGPSRQEVAARALGALERFRASFPPLHERRRMFAPATEVWLERRFGRGAVRVRGKVDLLLNRPLPGRANRVLIDFKSGMARGEYPEDMRLYALLFTLRSRVPPCRVATFFLSSGQWQVEEVTEGLLWHAASSVVDAVAAAADSAAGRPGSLTPGPHCAACPRRAGCPAVWGGPQDGPD